MTSSQKHHRLVPSNPQSLHASDISVAGDHAKNLDAAKRFPVEDDVSTDGRRPYRVTEMRLQLPKCWVFGEQKTFRLDLFDPCYGRIRFVPGDVRQDLDEILPGSRSILR